MVAFSVLFTIAAALIMLAVGDRLCFKSCHHKEGKHTRMTKWHETTGRYFSAFCVMAAMVLVIIAVWVFM